MGENRDVIRRRDGRGHNEIGIRTPLKWVGGGGEDLCYKHTIDIGVIGQGDGRHKHTTHTGPTGDNNTNA